LPGQLALVEVGVTIDEAVLVELTVSTEVNVELKVSIVELEMMIVTGPVGESEVVDPETGGVSLYTSPYPGEPQASVLSPEQGVDVDGS